MVQYINKGGVSIVRIASVPRFEVIGDWVSKSIPAVLWSMPCQPVLSSISSGGCHRLSRDEQLTCSKD